MSRLKYSHTINRSEITPQELYLSRRDFFKSAGILTAGTFLAACSPLSEEVIPTPTLLDELAGSDELGDPSNSFSQITSYNNFYEFSTNKEDVADLARDFKSSPWNIEVYGLVDRPRTFSMDEILQLLPQQERIYRLRCVEAWSMVIPWQGFPLADLLALVEPTAEAKYVRFETLLDASQMPGVDSPFFPWPYQEALRLDEAMHDLTILATGLYGEPLPAQDGAPIRLVVPWKYGFKSIKSIIKIELTSDQPETFWSKIAPGEYGFYANVNPQVDHPRWSQKTERRLGEAGRRATHMFNGYADQVDYLYDGLDLSENY